MIGLKNISNLNIVIAIDDTHPEMGWGAGGDNPSEYLHLLNQEFGCKFTHFVPSSYHAKFPLSQYKDWVDYWNSFDWIELAAHGHFHNRIQTKPGCRECEFDELDYLGAKYRIEQSLEQWDKVGYRPKGWRMPGWVATQGAFDAVSEQFDYVAIHKTLNNNINFHDIKVFRGENPIHNCETIILNEENSIFFQSHIAGQYNQNNWTKENYEYFRVVLKEFDVKGYNLQYKTFSEL